MQRTSFMIPVTETLNPLSVFRRGLIGTKDDVPLAIPTLTSFCSSDFSASAKPVVCL